jgi:hypothetical protein
MLRPGLHPAQDSLILCSAAVVVLCSSSSHPLPWGSSSSRLGEALSLSDPARTLLPVNRHQSKHLAQVATVPGDELLLRW